MSSVITRAIQLAREKGPLTLVTLKKLWAEHGQAAVNFALNKYLTSFATTAHPGLNDMGWNAGQAIQLENMAQGKGVGKKRKKGGEVVYPLIPKRGRGFNLGRSLFGDHRHTGIVNPIPVPAANIHAGTGVRRKPGPKSKRTKLK